MIKYFHNDSEPSDHNPHNMMEVFQNPEKYLEGPNGHLRRGEKHFTIVGAGISGLTLALLLVQLGHQVATVQSCTDQVFLCFSAPTKLSVSFNPRTPGKFLR